MSDPLTGLANRRHFETRWEHEQVASRRSNLPVTVVMADIDHFKLVTDRYGHAAGDEVLRRVAGALQASARAMDLVARVGTASSSSQ